MLSRQTSISHLYQRGIYRSFQVYSRISSHQSIRCCIFYGEFCGTSYDSFHRRIIVSQLVANCFCSENLAMYFGNLPRWYTNRIRCKIEIKVCDWSANCNDKHPVYKKLILKYINKNVFNVIIIVIIIAKILTFEDTFKKPEKVIDKSKLIKMQWLLKKIILSVYLNRLLISETLWPIEFIYVVYKITNANEM